MDHDYITIKTGKYAGWTLKVLSDVYVEVVEGEQHVNHVWFLVIANPYGDQFRHHHHFMFHESAHGFAINVFNKLSNCMAELNLDEHWYQIHAEYGSDAYLDYQEAEDVYDEYEKDQIFSL
ncbi:MAG: hypothetical protein BWY47_02146 [Bacteroidetes bacterium ADurb.Bin302]|nr:MAG: hypothetical protein BWY47_02146 [Bacteroidetes bacterium ADurb.Bin302]